MFRSCKRHPILTNLIGGSLFAVAIASHSLDRSRTQADQALVQLSPAEVADALAVVSEACRRISLQPGQKPVKFTADELANAMAMVSEVCAGYGQEPAGSMKRLQRSDIADKKLIPAQQAADTIET